MHKFKPQNYTLGSSTLSTEHHSKSSVFFLREVFKQFTNLKELSLTGNDNVMDQGTRSTLQNAHLHTGTDMDTHRHMWASLHSHEQPLSATS